MLTDAGALVAFLDKSARFHAECASVVRGLRNPMLTTWLAYGEAYYLSGKYVGQAAQDALLDMVINSLLEIHIGSSDDIVRMRQLIQIYKGMGRGGMDLADASLVVVAENLGLTTVFTLDSHFYAYVPQHTPTLTVVPAVRIP